jgi:hypothetical protein
VGQACQWLARGDAYRFGARLVSGWAGFSACTEMVPRALSSFSYFSFSLFFYIESFEIQKCLDLNNFKSTKF